MKKQFFKIATLASVLLAMTSCLHKAIEAVIPQKGYETERVAQVKSVAVIAYDVLQLQPTGLASRVSGTASTLQSVANKVPLENELANASYNYLRTELEKNNFKTMTLEALLKNSSYQKLSAQFNPSAQDKMTLNSFQKPFYIKGLMRPSNPEYQFKPEQIKQIGKFLSVDSIVIARLSYTTQKNDLLGLGVANIYLRGDMQFYMFDTKTAQLIWFDRGFLGAASDESIGKVSGLENVEDIERLNKPIAQKTITDFFKR